MTELETMLMQSLTRLTEEYEKQAMVWQNQYLDLKNQNELMMEHLKRLEAGYKVLSNRYETLQGLILEKS